MLPILRTLKFLVLVFLSQVLYFLLRLFMSMIVTVNFLVNKKVVLQELDWKSVANNDEMQSCPDEHQRAEKAS